MQDIFVVCLVLGAAVLILQVVLDIFASGHLPSFLDHAAADNGLDLLSVRGLAAGAMLFGAVGLWLGGQGTPLLIRMPAALIAGIAAAVGTGLITRQLSRLESSGSLRLEGAVGQAATVYLPVPPRREGTGKVQFTLQGRTVELGAIADEAVVLPTGAAVVVVSVVNGDTVEVMPTPRIEGVDA